ncbi:MAG TPA: hypothetical protein VFB21_01510 [Chthonomonadaceae bacterium]|nr:hypothetical protein [Chthonomonadaceae bacterium]
MATEWQVVVLVLQILLLAVGYFLFQQARAELNARAAETPVLGEVKALQRSVKQLLAEIEETADRTSERLERRCAEAQELLNALDHRIAAAQEAQHSLPTPSPERIQAAAPPRRREKVAKVPPATEAPTIAQGIAVAAENYTGAQETQEPSRDQTAREARRQAVYALADAGESPADIARATGLSEGEVETLLSLRFQRA